MSEVGEELAPERTAPGLAKYLFLSSVLVGFVGAGTYGSLSSWFVDRAGDPGSMIDPRLFSPLMGLLAATAGVVVGAISAFASWIAVKLLRARVGNTRIYLAASAGAAAATSLLSWFLLRNTEPYTTAIVIGAAFVIIAVAASVLGVAVYSRKLRLTQTSPREA